MPLYPSKVLRAREHASTLCSSVIFCFELTFRVPQEIRSTLVMLRALVTKTIGLISNPTKK
jgi:hypothetical protein